MALLEILRYPDPRLRTVASPVTAFDASLQKLAADMLETMYAAPGIGLAATQVDRHIRMLVIDVSEDQSAPLCLVNPEIIAASGSRSGEEGCLSVPEIYDTVERAEHIRVRASDPAGQPLDFEADGLLAVCIQHEMDHLDGKLFVDYLSALKRERLKKKLSKARRRDAPVPAHSSPTL